MSLYNINGENLLSAYGVNGGELLTAYDINGQSVYEVGDVFTVMTYNYQWCTKLNSQVEMQTAIINKYDPDIIGLQEAGSNNRNATVFPNVALQFLSNYTKELSDQATNRNGIASKIPYSNLQTVKFTQNDDENWDYMKCYITINGKTVAWYNTHLTYKTDSATLLRKYAQAEELFNDVENEEYAIITGDFNMYGQDLQSADYIGIGKQFADAGYKLVNWTPNTFVKTWTDAAAGTLDTFKDACDNIIVTPNIDVISVTFDTTKLSYLNGQPIDHIPVIAKLRI